MSAYVAFTREKTLDQGEPTPNGVYTLEQRSL
jgi:hypothetical protein